MHAKHNWGTLLPSLPEMTIDELSDMLRQKEGLRLEFKDSRILSDPFKLAKTMTAFSNAEGGTLIIGVRDDKSVEGMKVKKQHEEYIMNIASDRCDPRLSPQFQEVNLPEGDVCVIKVPERQGPFHAVKTKDGYKFFIRVGSTIRELTPSELGRGEKGVEIEVEKGLERFRSWLGKKILLKFYGKLDVNIARFKMILGVLIFIFIAISILLMFRVENGEVVVQTYSMWAYYPLAISLLLGALLADWVPYMPKTRCPKCNSYFSFFTVRKWVFEKRTIKEGLEEWLTRSLKRCNECGYEELGKLKYEKKEVE